MDLSGFIKAYIAYSGVEFKRKFKHSDENVYLLPMGGNFHLFIVAKSDGITYEIAPLDAESADVLTKIRELLNKGVA